MRKITIILMAALIALLLGSCIPVVASDAGDQDWDMLTAKQDVIQAWQDMRYGMFICWGPVTLTGLEIGWSRGKGRPDQSQGGTGPTPAEVYDNLYKKWIPEKFDAREWVKVAKDGGMKYIIFLVKHHDGFCLYDSKLTDYTSAGPESAWKHDALKDVADACHESGLKLIIYYSQRDWYHPDYHTANHARYIEFLHGQIREILTNYGRIDGLWFDLGGDVGEWESEKLFKMARTLQPWLIINNRCGLRGDYDTPENYTTPFQVDRAWECCRTLVPWQWSYKPNGTVTSLKDCINLLVTCAVGGGNLALNTGPMADGQIEPQQADRFREIGQWLKKYGKSIYGTRGGPFQWLGANAQGGTTQRGDTIYVHVLKWRGESIRLAAIPKKIVSHSVLTGGKATVSQTSDAITISVPVADRQELDTIIALKLDGPAADLRTVRVPSGSLTFGKPVLGSYDEVPGAYWCVRGVQDFAPEKAVDDDLETRWNKGGAWWLATKEPIRSAWLEVDLGKPMTFDRAFISEADKFNTRKFELQARQNGEWRAFYSGKYISDALWAEFAPVTARYVRLNLLETLDGPSIREFQLFAPEADGGAK